MGKTMYQSELVKLGPVKVTVKTAVQESKYQGKPPYVVLLFGNDERTLNLENENCAAIFDNRMGQQIGILAEGREADARITLVAMDMGQAPAPAAAAPAASGRFAKPAAPPPQQRQAAPPATNAAPATEQKQNRKPTPQGVTVGMAINNACANISAQGRPLEMAEVTEIASDILRVAKWLEEGNLCPSLKERQEKIKGAQQNPPQQ